MTDERNEAARRLGFPVCEVCSEPNCEPRHGHKGLRHGARLCDQCYVDWLRHEVRREVREEDSKRQLNLATVPKQAYLPPEWAQ